MRNMVSFSILFILLLTSSELSAQSSTENLSLQIKTLRSLTQSVSSALRGDVIDLREMTENEVASLRREIALLRNGLENYCRIQDIECRIHEYNGRGYDAGPWKKTCFHSHHAEVNTFKVEIRCAK